MTSKQQWHHKNHPPKKPFHYKGSGLDNVYLMSGYEIVADEDGDGVIIQNLDELHTAIAIDLVTEQKILSGKEVRYLRTYMDLSQSGLSRLLGCDSQTIARYEKGAHMPSPTDRLLRMIVLGSINKEVNVHEVVSQIEELEGRAHKKLKFEPTKHGWKTAC